MIGGTFHEEKVCKFGQIVKIANIEPHENVPLYGIRKKLCSGIASVYALFQCLDSLMHIAIEVLYS